MKKGSKFEWTIECQKTFDDHVAELPTLTSPKQGKTLFVYLAMREKAVNAVSIKEVERI